MSDASDASAQATRPDWRVRLGVPLGALVLRLLAATWRIEVRGDAGWLAVRSRGEGIILALWHGHILPLTWHLRGLGVQVLVSEHRDGEVIARLLSTLGYGLIRGSTTRGGARALVRMIAALRGGAALAITPDGPKGPARQFAPGTTVAAYRAGVPIATMFVEADRAWYARSWDRFMVPKPFSRVTIHFSDPALVTATNPAEAAADAPRFAEMLAPRAAHA
ncbi:MAG: DUF374 domain-containing protein [Gemmatimonadetes bacterium]|nr:DUF374 domain-containing protein [Gemmatimonadota bacterium]